MTDGTNSAPNRVRYSHIWHVNATVKNFLRLSESKSLRQGRSILCQSAADYDCMASWNLKLFTAKLEAGELIQDRIHCIANRNQSQVKYH